MLLYMRFTFIYSSTTNLKTAGPGPAPRTPRPCSAFNSPAALYGAPLRRDIFCVHRRVNRFVANGMAPMGQATEITPLKASVTKSEHNKGGAAAAIRTLAIAGTALMVGGWCRRRHVNL